MIEYRKGDLFAQYSANVLVHGCNQQGFMGKGIAFGFRRRWYSMYKNYKYLCETGKLGLGDVFFWITENHLVSGNLTIANLISQSAINQQASVWAIERGLNKIISLHEYDVIAMPKIGCGLGGLNWEQDVAPIVEKLEKRILVVEL